MTEGQAAARLADALEGLLSSTGWIPESERSDSRIDAGGWIARRALWDYANTAATGYEPYCSDDRDSPTPEVAYAVKVGDTWVTPTAEQALYASGERPA